MTLFGFIWLLLILFSFFSSNIKYILFLTIFSMILQCTNIVDTSSIQFGPQVITCLFFIIYYILKIKNIKKLKIPTMAISLICIYLVILLSSFINSTSIIIYLRIIMLGIYIVTFIIMFNLNKQLEDQTIYKIIKIITLFVLIMGIIQILTTSGKFDRIGIISSLFYNDHSYDVYYWHQNYSRLCSTFMEPSYCGCFLVAMFYYYLSIYNKEDKNIFILSLLAIEIVLTKSTTAYVAFAIGALLLLLFSKNKNVKRVFVPLIIIALLFLFIFKFEVINSVIFSKTTSGSFNARSNWNQRSLNRFYDSPLIGIGYKNIRGSSILFSLLGEIGLIGMILYVLFNIQYIYQYIKNKRNLTINQEGIICAIITIFISQVIACPDLDFCVYWLFLYLFALIFSKEKKYDIK